MSEAQDKYLPAEVPVITREVIEEYLYGSGTKLTDQQKAMFLKMAQLNGLNPFKREIYAIPYGDKFNIVTGYETYLKRAERTGMLDGWDADIGGDNGEYAYCTIYRKDRTHPITQKVWMSEYKMNNKMWSEKPRAMLIKVAIATCFRRAFPDEVGGLPYTSDEMPTSATDTIVVPQEAPKAIPAERPVQAQPEPQQQPYHPQQGVENKQDMLITEPMAKRLYAIAKKAGNSDEQIKATIKAITGQDQTRGITRKFYNMIVDKLEGKTESQGQVFSGDQAPSPGQYDESDIPF